MFARMVVLAGVGLAAAGCGLRLVGQGQTDGGAGASGAAGRQGGAGGGAGVAGMAGADAGGARPDGGDGGDGGHGGAGMMDPTQDPGSIAWKVPGWPVAGPDGALYTNHKFVDGARFARVEKVDGTLAYQIPGTSLCFGGAGLVVIGNLSPPGGLSAFRTSDGTHVWSHPPKGLLAQAACLPEADRLLVVVLGQLGAPPSFDAYRLSDGQPAWPSSPPVAGVPEIIGADADTAYVSTSPGGGAGTILVALRLSDGQPRWPAPHSAAASVSFALDGQGGLYAIDRWGKVPSVRRLGLSRGEVLWTYELKGPSSAAPAIAGSAGFIAVPDDNRLVALDKGSGAILWDYTANPGGRSATWDARFLLSGDVLVSGNTVDHLEYSSLEAFTTVQTIVTPEGVDRWQFPVGPAAEVIDGNSTPRSFVWEPRAGELYVAQPGLTYRARPETGVTMWAGLGRALVERILGSDAGLVFVAGPPQGCCFRNEWVEALDKNDGHLRWRMKEELPAEMSLFAVDERRVYLAVPPDSMYTPSYTVAVRK